MSWARNAFHYLSTEFTEIRQNPVLLKPRMMVSIFLCSFVFSFLLGSPMREHYSKNATFRGQSTTPPHNFSSPEQRVGGFVYDHIVHAAKMYTLIEGCGTPATLFEEHGILDLIDAERGVTSVYQEYPVWEGVSKALQEALGIRREITSLRDEFVKLYEENGVVRAALDDSVLGLHKVQMHRQALDGDTSLSTVSRLKLARDLAALLAAIPRDLLTTSIAAYMSLQPTIQGVLREMDRFQQYNDEATQDVFAETARLEDELRELPWYDAHILYRIYGSISRARPLRNYLAFLHDVQRKFQGIGSTVATLRDNLDALDRYVSWYKQLPLHATDGPSRRSLSGEVSRASNALAKLLGMVETERQNKDGAHGAVGGPRRVANPNIHDARLQPHLSTPWDAGPDLVDDDHFGEEL